MTPERLNTRFQPVRLQSRKTCEIPARAFEKNEGTTGSWSETALGLSPYLVIPVIAVACRNHWEGRTK